MNPPRVILASGSPQRRILLRGLGIEPLVMPGTYEECRVAGESPEAMVLRLAEGKARACAAQRCFGGISKLAPDFDAHSASPALLAAADTVVTIEGDILGKPRDLGDAFHMLLRLSGREHRVLTGLALARMPEGYVGGALDFDMSLAETKVRFRTLDEREIHAYLDREDVLGAAGSYRVQGLGVLLLDSIEGSWSNIIGLPLELFAARARGLGVCFL